MTTLVWFAPTLSALLLYGFGQGLIKKYSVNVPPANFCFYLVVSKLVVNGSYFLWEPHPSLWDPQGLPFLQLGLLAYLMDGMAWVLYFQSIISGPITIIGTVSAGYPAFTVLFARIFLGEQLQPPQYLGIILLMAGCIGLSYAPSPGGDSRTRGRAWIWQAGLALVIWGGSQTLVKYCYGLPQASDANLALMNALGGVFSLGLYAYLKADRALLTQQWSSSWAPMAMMALGDLAVIVASKLGPISIVAPVSGAYPVVTLAFAWTVLKERLSLLQWICVGIVLIGMVLGPGR